MFSSSTHTQHQHPFPSFVRQMKDENPSFTFTGEDEFIPFRSSIIRYTDETMGNRTEGRTKRKSVKANVTSKFSSKRKLSRMGKKVKKGKAGPSTEFITRSAALRKLQITLKDFRRLCILKGIYPRVPTKPLKGADKVYYDIKDISYIMNEPLLDRFRQFKAFMKKIRRAAGRNQFTEARLDSISFFKQFFIFLIIHLTQTRQ